MLRQFVEALGLKAPILVGHSFGGRVSIVYASRWDVTKVVLVDAAGIKPVRPLSYYIKVYSFKIARRIVPLLMGQRRGQALIDRWRNRGGSADYNNASPVMKGILSKVVNEDLTSLLPLIKAPTLLLWGENDTATPMRDARIMERLIPDAGLVAMPGCGHFSFLDNPATTRAAFNSFIN